MTMDRAIDRNTIVIDRLAYWTFQKVRIFPASQTPGKVIIGPASASDNPNANEWNIGDIRGGQGVEIMDVSRDVDRFWTGDIQSRYKDRIIMPRLATATSSSPAAAIQSLTFFQNVIVGSFSTAVHVYNNSTDNWDSAVRTLLNNATDSANGLVGGVDTLVIATGSEVDYATNTTTWARNSDFAIKYVVFWKDLFWGITQAGQMYYTDDLSKAWTIDARLQLPDDFIVKLLVARGPDREEHIYAATKVGLHVHDDVNQRFLPTDLILPFHPDAGKGTTVWRGSIYFPAGNAIYRFQAGSDQTIVVPVGPDQDHGLPADKRGVIVDLQGTHNELMQFLDASAAAGVSTLSQPTRGVGTHHGVTSNTNTGFSLIIGYDERGHETKWLSGSSAQSITVAEVASAYNVYRMWWAADQTVYFMSLPIDVVNPLQVTDTDYAPTGRFETPWNDMNIRNQVKTALDVLVETNNPTTSETIIVEYATNYDETYTVLDDSTITDGKINTTGLIQFRILIGGDPVGEVFRSIKFRITFARGSITTNTAQLIKLTLVWDAVVNITYGIAAAIDVREISPDGREPLQQVIDLRATLAKGELGEWTYRNDATEVQNYYMRMRDLQGFEEAGDDSEEAGIWQVTGIEPRQSRAR